VPFVVVNPPRPIQHLADGRLSDVAPTLLDLLGLPQPAVMTGHSLIAAEVENAAAEMGAAQASPTGLGLIIALGGRYHATSKIAGREPINPPANGIDR